MKDLSQSVIIPKMDSTNAEKKRKDQNFSDLFGIKEYQKPEPSNTQQEFPTGTDWKNIDSSKANLNSEFTSAKDKQKAEMQSSLMMSSMTDGVTPKSRPQTRQSKVISQKPLEQVYELELQGVSDQSSKENFKRLCDENKITILAMNDKTNAVTSELTEVSKVRIKCSEADPSLLKDVMSESGFNSTFLEESHGLKSGPAKEYLRKKKETNVMKGKKRASEGKERWK